MTKLIYLYVVSLLILKVCCMLPLKIKKAKRIDTAVLAHKPKKNVVPSTRDKSDSSELLDSVTLPPKITTPAPDINDYDDVVWCKFQPNSYYCDRFSGHEFRRRNYRRYIKRGHKFYYDIQLQGCKTFRYNGCQDTKNIFENLKACYDTCKFNGPTRLPDLPKKIGCYLQPDFGLCNEYFPMWYFDISHRKCRGFSYSGCAGNINKHNTKKVCEDLCFEYVTYKLESQETISRYDF